MLEGLWYANQLQEFNTKPDIDILGQKYVHVPGLSGLRECNKDIFSYG